MSGEAGNKLWRALSDDINERRSVLPELAEGDVTSNNITLLVAHLIHDSKYNVAKQNQFYEDSKAFLLNENKELENWLDMVQVDDMDRILWKLRDFVYNGCVDTLAYLRRMV